MAETAKRPVLNDWYLLRIFGAVVVCGIRTDTGQHVTRQLLWWSHGHFGTEPQPIASRGRWIGGQFRVGTPRRT